MAKENKELEVLTLVEFEKQITDANKRGAEATTKHKVKFPAPKERDKDGQIIMPKGSRYHAAGTDTKCPFCNVIIKAHNDMMKLQVEQIGLFGIPIDNLMSAVKVTRGVLKMMKKGGEL